MIGLREVFHGSWHCTSVVTTNDLEVLIIGSKEVLFFGTDQGLYMYTFAI